MKYFKSILLFTACFLLLISCQPSEPTGVIYVKSNPTGADVYLDGQSTGKKTDCNFENVKIGGRVIKLTKSGYLDWEQTVTVNQGQTSTVEATLTTELATGNIQINSTPTGAKIYLDGTDTDYLTNYLITNIPIGEHVITLTKSGYVDWEQAIMVNEGQTTTINATLIEGGHYDTPGYAMDVYVSGSYVYVADYYAGLRIINISNPLSPTEVGYYDIPGYAMDVYVSGSYVYVADFDDGLQIIKVKP